MELNHKKLFEKYKSNPLYTITDLSRDTNLPIAKLCLTLKKEGYILKVSEELERSFFINTFKKFLNEVIDYTNNFLDLIVISLRKTYEFLVEQIKNFEIYKSRIVKFIKEILINLGLYNPESNRFILGVD